jgi:hypothetical protein
MIHVDRKYILILAALLSSTRVCHPQAVAVAEVQGQVSDASSAAVAGAQIKMTQIETRYVRSTTAGADGSYSFPNLPVGPYTLEVAADGFKTHIQSGIILQVGGSVQINVTLQIGSVAESVKVTASAGMVETRNNSVAQVIDERRIVELPLNGRQATDLIVISGAATPTPNANMISSKNYSSSTTMSIAGGQGNGTNYLLDGGDNTTNFTNVNMPFPFPDALQEFSVETSSLPARNGLHPGGVVNVVTKSGTNQVHGDLFEFLRNGDVNARNFFGVTHDSLKRNQFGGDAGGRIIRDKLFFFGGAQLTRNRQNPPQTISYVPTPSALGGDFSGLESAACQTSKKTRTINDPKNNGAPFPNAQVPVSRFNPAALKLENYLPASNDPCGKVTYGIPTTGDEDQVIGRIDWNKSAKHSLYARYFLAQFSNPAVWNPHNALVTTQAGNLERGQSFTIGDTYSFNPTTLNAFHATVHRMRNNRGPSPSFITAKDLGVNIYVETPNNMQLTVSNAFTVGCGTCAPGFFNITTYSFADDMDLIRGRHQIAFGVNLLRSQDNLDSGYNQNGIFTFNGQATNDPMVDFLLGSMSTWDQSRAQLSWYRKLNIGLYVQDTYRVSNRLSINAGLRWEPNIPPVDIRGVGSLFDQAAFNAGQHSKVFVNGPAGELYYGDPGVPKTFTKRQMALFSPRLGLVWNPHGDGRDTVRVGGAILYDSPEVYYGQRLTSNSPYAAEIVLNSPSSPFNDPWQGYPGGNPFPGQNPPPSSVIFPTSAQWVNEPLLQRDPYTAQWNVSYQRQFAKDWMASVSYLGNKTTHVWLAADLNHATYIPGNCGSVPCSTTGNTNQRRLLYLARPQDGQYFSGLFSTDDGGNANYNGILTSVQHRFSGGFTLLANYTWSHCLSYGDINGNIGTGYYQDDIHRAPEYGSCAYDIRHMVNVTGVAVSPVTGKTLAGRLLGNWKFAPLIRATTGMALTVTSGKDNSLTAIGRDRPNQVLVSPYPATQTPVEWINPAAFVPNSIGTFGDLGRNSLRAPGMLRVDAALSREFAITERMRLEARGEGFNVINHANFSAPNTNLSSSSFGRITSASDPRILQFALKLHF